MALDVAMQLALTTATYAAMAQGSAVGYKLSVAESIMDVIGTVCDLRVKV
jgi:hypothetical protein